MGHPKRRPSSSSRRRILRYEGRSEPLLPIEQFLKRQIRHVGAATLLIGVSLGLGVFGYKYFLDLPWLDALLNASMILTGMGPVDPAKTAAAKIFASAYALFSGVAFITGAGIGFAPLAHRLLHRFHLGEDSDGKSDGN